MATVLVVDDEPDLRSVLRLDLSHAGHRVLEASSGAGALGLVRAQPVDVIVLDLGLAGGDGWEFLGAVKGGSPAVAAVPVIVLSGRTGELDRLRAAIEGAIMYIAKPLALDEVRRAVDQANQGEPEPVKRRRAQHQALTALARLQRGLRPDGDGLAPRMARPRLTRLEPVPSPNRVRRPPAASREPSGGLSPGQWALLRTVGTTDTVRDAAERLGVSRSYVYATLRRIAHKLGAGSGPELVGLVRAGGYGAPE